MRKLIATLLLTFPVAGLAADDEFPDVPEPTQESRRSKTQDFPTPTTRSSSTGPVLRGHRHYIADIPMLSHQLNPEANETPNATPDETTEWERMEYPPSSTLPPMAINPQFRVRSVFGQLPQSSIPIAIPHGYRATGGMIPPSMLTDAQCPEKAIQYRVQSVYRLRNQSAARVARQVESSVKECFPPSLQALAQTAGFKVIVVAEPVTNSLIVSAPQCAALAIAAKISEFDRAPQRFHLNMKISQGDSPSKKKLIASPQIVTLAGQKATIQISQSDGKILEFEVKIVGLDNDSLKTNKTDKPGKVTLRKPQPYHAFTRPRPLTVVSHRQPPLRYSTTAVPPAPAEPPARIRLTAGVWSSQNVYSQPQNPQSLSVRRYPISDLLRTNGNRKNSQTAETIQEFIKVGVEPQSWQSAGGSCSLFLLKSSNCLLIRHDTAGHRQVRELLQALRAANCGPIPSPLPLSDDPHIQRFTSDR